MNNMRRAAAVSVLLATMLFLAVGCGGRDGPALEGFCGSAGKPALQECARVFEERTGVRVDLHFSGSGTMLSKLRMSRQGDFYIPGSPDYMARAREAGDVIPETESKVAYLVPSILAPDENPAGVQGLSDLDRGGIEVGIGNPRAVCVGLYAVEVLEKNGALGDVRDRIDVQARSCSATASLVAMDKVDAILGWRVFGEWQPKKIDIVPLEPDNIPRLAYIPAAVSSYSENPELAGRFIEFLNSPQGRDIFAKWGYIPSEEKARTYAPDAEIGGTYDLPALFTREGGT
ncbi:MAG: molybdate ABC transporter substrate-binding protein [Planctomycetota bacterium]